MADPRKQIRATIKRISDQWTDVQPAWLGDLAGVVVTSTPGVYNARLINGKVVQVYNYARVPADWDMPVKIGRHKASPTIWQIIEGRQAYTVPVGGSRVEYHHEQHEFMQPDMVMLDIRQIYQFSVLVSDAAGFIVTVYGRVPLTANGYVKIDTQAVDLSSYVVTAGAKFVAIESDDDGILSIQEGTSFDAPEVATSNDLPVPAAGKYTRAFVLFYEGQTELSNDDILVPMPPDFNPAAYQTGTQISDAPADTPLDADKFGFWDVVDSTLKSITWANLKTLIGVLLSALALDDLIDVDAPSPTDGQVLTFDSYAEVWVAEDPSAAQFNDDEGDPAPVGVAADGTSSYAARRDHVHGGGSVAPHEPGGRPTLVSGTPVMTSEQANKTAIYYTPYKHDLVPIYSGSWLETAFTELTLNLDSDSGHTGYHEVNKQFDLFVYNDGGTLRLLSGPVWTSGTARATAIERINGVWMNAASMTGRFGTGAGDTVTVAQDRGTYVGTFRAISNGQTTWKLGGTGAGGNPGLLYLWSAYHRVPVVVQVRDNTDSWTYGTSNTWRPLNNNSNNIIEFVRGLDEDYVRAELNYQCLASATGYAALAVGLDSTSSPTGILFRNGSTAVAPMSVAKYAGQPGIGLHYVMGLEYTDNGATPVTFYGDAGQSFYQGGLQAEVFA